MPASPKNRSFYLVLAILAGLLGALALSAGAMLLSPRVVRAYGPEVGLWMVFACFLIGMIGPAVAVLKIADRIAPESRASKRQRRSARNEETSG